MDYFQISALDAFSKPQLVELKCDQLSKRKVMQAPELQTELLPVDLGDGVIAQVEVIETGREQVGAGTLPFDSVAKAITKISQVVSAPIQAVKPNKATVKYGLAIGIEQGSLVAVIVRGTGAANLEITLEWENKAENGIKR